MSLSKKRKQCSDDSHSISLNHTPSIPEADDFSQTLFIPAYETDIIRGPHAAQAARSLEAFDYTHLAEASSRQSPPQRVGDSLIRWNGHNPATPLLSAFPSDDEDTNIQVVPDTAKDAIWVDRYDARLLLDTLPAHRPALPCAFSTQSTPDSPTGWSDLPSDSEDTFFFSPAEAKDFRRDKKRRLIEKSHEERLKARLAEDGESAGGAGEVWGGSDEEPEDTQKELMRRTAAHLSSSPNPAQLEMRILANHGRDARLAFLRGRWSRTWTIIKGKARIEVEKQRQEAQSATSALGLGSLVGYGDSDEGSDGGGSGAEEVSGRGFTQADKQIMADPPAEGAEAAAAVIQARRARARGWTERRRALRERGG